MANFISKSMTDIRRIFKKDTSGTMRSILKIMSGSTNVWNKTTKITVLKNDGTEDVITTLNLPTGTRFGTTLSSISTPTRNEFFSFAGWVDASNNAITSGTLVTDDDMTIYAKWDTNLPSSPYGSEVVGYWEYSSIGKMWTYTGYMNPTTTHPLKAIAIFSEKTSSYIRELPSVYDPRFDNQVDVPWILINDNGIYKEYAGWTTDGYVYIVNVPYGDGFEEMEYMVACSTLASASTSLGSTLKSDESTASYFKFAEMDENWTAKTTIYLGAGTSGKTGSIDWGDGTVQSITESTTATNITHVWQRGVKKTECVRVSGTWKYISFGISAATAIASNRPLIAVCHYAATGALPTYAYANQTDLIWANIDCATGALGNYSFSGCTALKVINAPNITGMGSYMCVGSSNLYYVKLDSVSALGGYAFRDTDGSSIGISDVYVGGKEVYSLTIPTTWNVSSMYLWGKNWLGKDPGGNYVAYHH